MMTPIRLQKARERWAGSTEDKRLARSPAHLDRKTERRELRDVEKELPVRIR